MAQEQRALWVKQNVLWLCLLSALLYIDVVTQKYCFSCIDGVPRGTFSSRGTRFLCYHCTSITDKKGNHMSTQEDRIAALERKVAALELRRLYDERKAEESTPSVQVYNLREINENMTILLGVASSQGEDIKKIKNDLSILKERMEQRFTSLETKVDQVLRLLTTLTTRPDQET